MLARTVQGLLLMGTRLFQQSNRNLLGLLLVFMAKDMQFGTSEKGTLLSAIAAGYLFTQIPGGALADKLGAKFVMAVSLFSSGAMCMVIPMVADRFGLDGLWLTIVCMGAVQGPLFPTSSVYLSRWLPKKSATSGDEKAWGTAMLDIGISVGSLLIIPVANSLAEAYGWRAAYQIVGGATVAFVGVWQLLAAETPRACWYIGADELAFLEMHVAAPKGAAAAVTVPMQSPARVTRSQSRDAAGATVAAGAPSSDGASGAADGDRLGRLLGIPTRVALHPGVWAVFVAHIAFNFGAYYMTNWNPTYYAEVLGLSAAEARIHLSMPHVARRGQRVAPWRRRSWPTVSSLGCIRRLEAALGTREKAPSESDPSELPWPWSQAAPKAAVFLAASDPPTAAVVFAASDPPTDAVFISPRTLSCCPVQVTNLLAKSANPALVRLVERRNISLLGSRRLFTAVGFVVAALALLPVARLSAFDPWVSTFFFSLANMFFGLAPSGFKANYLDITEEYVGILSGYGNTLGTVASWAGPKLVAALLLRFGSWDLVLAAVAASNVIASLNYWRHSTVEVVERIAGSKKA